jgi:hypothetical protein
MTVVRLSALYSNGRAQNTSPRAEIDKRIPRSRLMGQGSWVPFSLELAHRDNSVSVAWKVVQHD